MKQGHGVKSRPQRVLWLKDHPKSWNFSPREVFEMMQQDGLYAPSTYWNDCVGWIRETILELKGAGNG